MSKKFAVKLAVTNHKNFAREYDFTPAYDASTDSFICECGGTHEWREVGGAMVLECGSCGHAVAHDTIDLVGVAQFRLAYLAGVMASKWVAIDHAQAFVEAANREAATIASRAYQGRVVNALIFATSLLAGTILIIAR